MFHPTPEEWMAYLYGELDKKSGAPLRTHLQECAECQAQLVAWQGAMAHLDSWKMPDVRKQPRREFHALRWAIAAAVLVIIGYGVGRATRGPDAGDLRASVEASVRQDLLKELKGELSRATAASLGRNHAESAEVAARVSSAVTREFLSQFAEAIQEARLNESDAMAAALANVESNRLRITRPCRKGWRRLYGACRTRSSAPDVIWRMLRS